ncbi:hypothetical protein BT69DRAFT_474251 [Atractiella rhizophila]|nr:hypothetical protein BT69DRAFT_474251 [Atractiella rhizophila]
MTSAPLTPYTLQPPKYLPPLSHTLSLGHPSFHPPQQGQDEDDSSRDVVANGYVRTLTNSSENFSAHSMVQNKIDVPFLAGLFGQVEKRKREKVGEIPKSTFKLPSKITLNEQKRESWLVELSNPSVPLLKLSRTLPHGYKGEKLLSAFLSRSVPLERALWFIRLHTLTEIRRSKAQGAAEKIVLEWTREVGEFIRKLLGEITMPVSEKEGGAVGRLGGRSGVTVKSKARHVLLQREEGGRERWKAKWVYATNLVDQLVAENLLDISTYIEQSTQNLLSANLPQLPFVLHQLRHNLHIISDNEYLARSFVNATLRRLPQIESLPNEVGSIKTYLLSTLRYFIRTTFLGCPDAFASRTLWNVHRDRIWDALFGRGEDGDGEDEEGEGGGDGDGREGTGLEGIDEEMLLVLEEDWETLEDRVRVGEADVWRERERELVSALDAFNTETDLDKLFDTFFSPSATSSTSVSSTPPPPSTITIGSGGGSREIALLLSFSLTPHRTRPFRRYLAGTLLSRLPSAPVHEALKAFFTSHPSDSWTSISRERDKEMIQLASELIRRRVLELGKLASLRSNGGGLREMLKCLPVHGMGREAPKMLEVFLHEEEFKEARMAAEKETKELRAWLRGALPNIFGGTSYSRSLFI